MTKIHPPLHPPRRQFLQRSGRAQTIDFEDFSSAAPVEFRLYGYNVNSASGGLRYDDIRLMGEATTNPQPNPASRGFSGSLA